MLKEIINENGHPQMVDDETLEPNKYAINAKGEFLFDEQGNKILNEVQKDGGVSDLAALATATPEQSDFLKGTPSEFNGGQSSDPTPDISVLTAEIATLMTRFDMLEKQFNDLANVVLKLSDNCLKTSSYLERVVDIINQKVNRSE